jgi:hypothetical protein
MTAREYKFIEIMAADMSGLPVETWAETLGRMLHTHIPLTDMRLLMREYNRLIIAFSTILADEKIH